MKKISLVRAGILTSLVTIPFLVFAQTGTNVAIGIGTFAGLIDAITGTIVKSAATLLLSLALLAFFYGIVEYIWAKRKGDAAGTKAGNQFMTWGLIALFVMFSVYGIIKFAQNTLAPGTDWSTITIPNIQFKSGGVSGVPTGAPGYTSPGATGGIPTGAPGTTGTTGVPLNGSCTTSNDCAGALVCTAGKCANYSGGSGGNPNPSQTDTATAQANCENQGMVYNSSDGSCTPVSGTTNPNPSQTDPATAQANCDNKGWKYNPADGSCVPFD